MEFDNPVRRSNGIIHIKIESNNILLLDYTTSETKPEPKDTYELISYIKEISSTFQDYSKRWFNTDIKHITFMESVVNVWKYESDQLPAYTDVIKKVKARQEWTVNSMDLDGDIYKINWNIHSCEYTPIINIEKNSVSGCDEYVDIPYAEDSDVPTIIKSPRATIKERIRRARIKATAAKLKLEMLTESYYIRYGSLEHIDRDSELSSEIDSNTESVPKK